jgi:hypothetical protein
LQESKGGPLARLWDKVKREQTVKMPLANVDYFVEQVATEERYAYVTDKLYLMTQIPLICPTCALLKEDFSPMELAMVVSKGAPIKRKMNAMYV